jgi:hypothetical protein
MPALSPVDLEKTFIPSRGINPSFGHSSVDRQDGDHCLYALQFDGDLEALLGLKSFEVRGQVVLKVLKTMLHATGSPSAGSLFPLSPVCCRRRIKL